MSEVDASRKFAIECLRLGADCMQLAGAAPTPALQRHYLEMAKQWATWAEMGPETLTLLDDDEGSSA